MSTFKDGDRVTFPIVGDLMVKGVVKPSARVMDRHVCIELETNWDRTLPDSGLWIEGDVYVPETIVKPVEVIVEVTLTAVDAAWLSGWLRSNNFDPQRKTRLLDALDAGWRHDR